MLATRHTGGFSVIAYSFCVSPGKRELTRVFKVRLDTMILALTRTLVLIPAPIIAIEIALCEGPVTGELVRYSFGSIVNGCQEWSTRLP